MEIKMVIISPDRTANVFIADISANHAAAWNAQKC